MKPRAAGEADDSFLVQSDEVRQLKRHGVIADGIEIMNMHGSTCTCWLQVGEHFDGIQQGSSRYSPNAYVRMLYPEDL